MGISGCLTSARNFFRTFNIVKLSIYLANPKSATFTTGGSSFVRRTFYTGRKDQRVLRWKPSRGSSPLV